MLFYVFSAGSGILVVLGLYVLLKTKRTYDSGKTLSTGISLGWWVLDTVHCLLVILSSLYTVWPISINKMAALIGGSVMFGVGMVMMLAGMTEFRSMRRISGLETSELVTTGIYRWSRNPQYIGWFLVLLGISLIGSSGLALLYTMIGIILFHFYTIQMEEPYLEHVIGEKYLLYKERTPRYIGIPKRKKVSSTLFQIKKADRVFTILGSLVFFSALLVTLWDFVKIQEMACRLTLVNVVGLGLFLIGVSVRIVARRTLGKYFSSDLKTPLKHELIKHGICKRIRHPAYLGSLLLSIGIPLSFSSLYGFLLTLGLIPCFLYRMRIEESMLLKKFGEECLKYMKNTKKIIPFVY